MCRCLPDRTLPNALKDSYQKGQWTDYMGRVMAYIGGCVRPVVFMCRVTMMSVLKSS